MTRLIERLARLQRERSFKLIASILVLVLGAIAYSSLLVSANAPDAEARLLVTVSDVADGLVRDALASTPVPTDDQIAERLALRVERLGLQSITQDQAMRAVQRAHERLEAPGGIAWLDQGPFGAIDGLLRNATLVMTTQGGAITVGVGVTVICMVIIMAIWLGIGLSFTALLLGGWGIAWPLMLIPPTAGFGQLLMGIVPLALMFITLLQAMRVVLSPSLPMTAVARNVLSEAVRMRIGVVFIVVMLFLMAIIPLVQVENQPLRYRVQQWMQYGLGLSYAILVLLTVFLSVSTVAFEQRDKMVWQTMTKPVQHWQYLLGKWLGIMSLNLVLLSVAAGGVYLFTEYLRFQPAQGERAYHIDLAGNPTRGPNAREPSTDRQLLERQVLVARIVAEPDPFELTPQTLERRVRLAMDRMPDATESDREEIRRSIQAEWDRLIETRLRDMIEERRMADPANEITEQEVAQFRQLIIAQFDGLARAIAPGERRDFIFDLAPVARRLAGIRSRIQREIDREIDFRIREGTAREEDRQQLETEILVERIDRGDIPPMPELTIRYKVQAGSNDPTAIYRFYFLLNGFPYPDPVGDQMRPISAALNQFQTLSAPSFFVPDSGILELSIISDRGNPRVAVFQPGDIQILFPAGGYELNFIRVIAVLWIKLGFIAAVGVLTGSFLAFPVACLVTLAIMFMAESAGFLRESLEYYHVDDHQGNIKPFNVLGRAISLPISWIFATYADLKPIERLVDGRLLSWRSVAWGMSVILAWTAAVLIVAWAIFRKRELAIYSGN